MAELELEARDLVLGTFLAAYNEAHGTHYDRFTDGPLGADYDFECQSSGQEPVLRVQHTRAWADPETEWRHPKDVENFVIRTLKARLRALDLRDFHVSISVDHLPAKRGAKILLVEEIWNAVEYGLDHEVGVGGLERILEFDRDDIGVYFDPIRPFVSNLEVLRAVPPTGNPATAGWSSMGGSTEGVHDSQFRIEQALQKKEGRYQGTGRDLILIIDFEVMPYFEDEVDALRSWLVPRQIAFKEVWISSQWMPPSAHRIWLWP